MRLPGTAADNAFTLPLLLARCSTPPSGESPRPPRTEAASPSRSATSSTTPSSRAPESPGTFSYRPWGNLGFFYNAEGSTFSNDLTKIGETEDIVQIKLRDGQQVTIAVAG
ncbi:cyclophilin-like fold protein [Arthrobacter sp. StoSoilB20]|uniref:cyclophilin-like fold protein n=1 Tax=Arthrobacter sp. StoSoilB20 TaxID=2830995 RepID=UPI001CC5052A|nr:cyclophilin-like fold protein [Arthrobacter sp. StoSoilB20]BCW58626.1 hypothetical protein StoSoilB20_19730 [Arthrobacter sp. StoSoilB20]